MFILFGVLTSRKKGCLAMTYECQRCGDCCSTMGEIISILEQIRPYEFRIGYPDGEERIVSVDPDKRLSFHDQRMRERESIVCPFLMQPTPREYVCTVHASRPELCRNYLCSRILILYQKGNKAGRVPPGTRSFTTEDRTLLELWCHTLRDIPVPDDEIWENWVDGVFTSAGYRVIR